VAAPVLLISSDPSLGARLEAVARGRVRVASLDPVRRPAAWPAEPAATVVLDVTARQRDAAYAWVRHHHPGPLVVLLKPGERDPKLPPDPTRVVVRRPFRLADLVAVLERPPAPAPAAPAPVVAADHGQDAGSRGLLQASATQRMRRLGSLSAPAAPVPAAVRRPPRPEWPTAATRLDGRRRRRKRSGRRVMGRVLLGALALLAVAGAWLAFGLLEAREDLRVGAAAVRTELASAEAALERGDPAAARAAVQAAARNLEFAGAVPERRELRVAAHLPVLSWSVSDARHLLAAARDLTGAGERAVAVVTHLESGRLAAPRRGRFDLDALDDARGQAEGLVADLERVRGELEQVRGGPLSPGAGEIKRWALGRLEEASARARPIVPTLEALPAALGAGQPRTYLVALTNPAELRPSGGAPLAVLEVVLDQGRVEVGARTDERAERSLAGSSPHFPAAAQELLRAWRAAGRPRPDGVVAIDPLAMRALLEATGPVVVPGYGRLDAGNCVRRITRDAEVRWPDPAERRRHHEGLLDALVARFLGGPDLVTTGRVLGAAGPRRNVQVYAADASLQGVLARHRLDGSLADPDGDYLAVHTRNRNGSRVDAFQRRSIRQVVRLAADGSAEVSRTVTVVNAVPAGEPAQPAAGPGASSRAAAVLATYLPPGAALTAATLDGRPVRPATATERGRPLLLVDLDLGRGQSATLTVGYRLAEAATFDDGRLRYRLTADPQALVTPPVLRVEVAAPPGMAIAPAAGWTVRGATATRAGSFADPVTAVLDLHG
jgi:hypothetical protein